MGQKRRRSSKPIGEAERQGREYYLRPALDSLEAAFPSKRWSELQIAPFEHNLIHLESFAAAVCFEQETFIDCYEMPISSDRPLVFQVLGYASLCRARFTGMQQDYHRLKEEHEKAIRAADRY